MYYTPDIEDIRVGYEAEVNWEFYRNSDGTKSSHLNGWKPVIFKGVDEAVRKYHEMGMYRVPYLTKEQIEAEGWEKDTNHPLYKGLLKFKNSNGTYWVRMSDNNKIDIICYTSTEGKDIWTLQKRSVIFEGYCPSINEFRYITKLLKI